MTTLTHAQRLEMAEHDLRSRNPANLLFRKHLSRHPKLYPAFEAATLELIKAGHVKFSHWMVMNYVRYNVHSSPQRFGIMRKHEGEEFKIPNDVVSMWARKFIVEYPQYDVFRIKPLKYGWRPPPPPPPKDERSPPLIRWLDEAR